MAVCELYQHRAARAGGEALGPSGYCDDCAKGRHRQQTRATIERIIPDQLRQAAKALYKNEHRADLMAALYRWIGTDKLGSVGGPSCLLVHGSRGSGKSVAAAWAIAKSVNDEVIGNALYMTEDEFIRERRGEPFARAHVPGRGDPVPGS